MKISFMKAYNKHMQVLIVEDNEKIANLLRRGLIEEHYSVDIALNGLAGTEKIEVNTYDLMIFDIMLPKKDGIALCRDVRNKNLSVPILLLTAKDSIEDKVMGLDAGADDYVTKPFSMTEVLARVRALIRRAEKAADPTVLSLDTLTMNPATQKVTRDGKDIILTAREYALLEYFMRNKNIVMSKTKLLEHVWDYNYDGLSNIVETYIRYVRKKIQISPQNKELIHTRRGSGYIFTDH